MKKLFILVFVLLGTVTIANAQEVGEVSFTVEWPTGIEEFTLEGSAINLPCCGETIAQEGRPDNGWIRIPVFWDNGCGNSGRFTWYGTGEGTVGSSHLYDFLMAVLDAIPDCK